MLFRNSKTNINWKIIISKKIFSQSQLAVAKVHDPDPAHKPHG